MGEKADVWPHKYLSAVRDNALLLDLGRVVRDRRREQDIDAVKKRERFCAFVTQSPEAYIDDKPVTNVGIEI